MKMCHTPMVVALLLSLNCSVSWASPETCIKACKQGLTALQTNEQKAKASQCQAGCLSVPASKGALAIEMRQLKPASAPNQLMIYRKLQTKQKTAQ